MSTLFRFSVVALFWWAPAASGSNMLFEVSDAQGGKAYVVGSEHGGYRPISKPLTSRVEEVLAESDGLYLEVKTTPREFNKGLARASLGFWKTLESVLSPTVYKSLQPYLEVIRSESPNQYHLYNHHHPSLLVAELQSRIPTGSSAADGPGISYDAYLEKFASSKNLPVKGLEVPIDFYEIHSRIPVSEVEGCLMGLMRYFESESVKEGGPEFSRRLNLQLAQGNVDAIANGFVARFEQEFGCSSRFIDLWLFERNRYMANRISDLMKKGKVYFFAPGAAHLGGANGILNLLRQKEFTVRKICAEAGAACAATPNH